MKLEDEKNQLRLNLDDTQNRLTRTELLRQSLEGDFERLKLALNDTETENQVVNNRAENLTREVHDLEKKTLDLTTTIDRLNLTLTKSEQQESAYKKQVLSLSYFYCVSLHKQHSALQSICLFVCVSVCLICRFLTLQRKVMMMSSYRFSVML